MDEFLEPKEETRQNICSVVFCARMGVAIYSPLCDLIMTGTMRICQPDEFTRRLNAMRDRWNIRTMIVQAFGEIPPVGQKTIEAVKAVFHDHILVHRDQWNPIRMGFKKRKTLAEVYLADKIKELEQVDALLMGHWIYDILRTAGVPFPASYLDQLAKTTRRFPRRQDLSRFHGRVLAEALHQGIREIENPGPLPGWNVRI